MQVGAKRVADFRADRKWQGYLDWCDRYFWAVDRDFPAGLLPDGHALVRGFWVVAPALCFLLSLVLLYSRAAVPFLYFQF